MEGYLNYCPRCGKSSIDADRHGSPGIGLCRDCGTLFSVMSVKLGEKLVPLTGGAVDATDAAVAPTTPRKTPA